MMKPRVHISGGQETYGVDKNQKVQSRFCVRAGVSRAYCEDFWICESPLDLIRKSMDFLRKSTGLLALRARSPWTSGQRYA